MGRRAGDVVGGWVYKGLEGSFEGIVVEPWVVINGGGNGRSGGSGR